MRCDGCIHFIGTENICGSNMVHCRDIMRNIDRYVPIDNNCDRMSHGSESGVYPCDTYRGFREQQDREVKKHARSRKS